MKGEVDHRMDDQYIDLSIGTEVNETIFNNEFIFKK